MTVMPVDRGRGGLVASISGQMTPLPAERVPLTGVRIDVVAQGVASAVTVSQRYVNLEKMAVEAVYSFPLEEQAAVFGFEALIGDKRVVGEVMEKDKAFDEYDRAMAEGDGAYLLDQDRPNLFTASIGNLLPGQQAVVTVKYVAKLERLGDQVRLKIPTTVSPRYIPAEQLRQMDPSEFDHLNPPTVPGGVPYGLALSVSFKGASTVTSVECPSHPVRVSTRGKNATVELSGPDVQLDQDLVVTFTMKDAGESALYLARDDAGDSILMLDVLPPRDVHRASVEAVFLIDRSGSMMGSSIQQARSALLLALSSLQEGDWFNVIGFGTQVDQLFDRSVAYADESLSRARAAVQSWDADLGGTDIMTPLTRILEAPAGELPRRLLVLTDGEVANEADCLALAGRHPETTVFTIGVGRGASDHLVRGLARAGRGQAEFVHPGERIESALMRQVARLTTTGLLEPRIDWGGLEVDLSAPAQLPPLYPGSPLTVFARVPGHGGTTSDADAQIALDDLAGRIEIALTTTSPEGEVRMTASADLADSAADAAIPRLFAREAIRDLEEGRAGAAARGSQQRDRREGRVRDSIVELATRYTLMSSYTSFVAVEQREGEAASDLPPAELRRIPVALLADWHGSGVVAGLSMGKGRAQRMRGLASPSPHPGLCLEAYDECSASSIHGFTPGRGSSFSLDGLDSLVVASTGEPSAHADAALVVLVGHQRADGSWPLDDGLFVLYGVPGDRLSALATALHDAVGADADTTATALAVRLLRGQFADLRPQWHLAVEKAEAWLASRGLRVGVDDLWAALDHALRRWSLPYADGAGSDSPH